MAYTDAMVATLRKNAPLNLEKAKQLAGEMGVSYRSVISKAKQLGVEYVKAQPATKKKDSAEPTKAEILTAIRTNLGLAERDGDLTKAELAEILLKLG